MRTIAIEAIGAVRAITAKATPTGIIVTAVTATIAANAATNKKTWHQRMVRNRSNERPSAALWRRQTAVMPI